MARFYRNAGLSHTAFAAGDHQSARLSPVIIHHLLQIKRFVLHLCSFSLARLGGLLETRGGLLPLPEQGRRQPLVIEFSMILFTW